MVFLLVQSWFEVFKFCVDHNGLAMPKYLVYRNLYVRKYSFHCKKSNERFLLWTFVRSSQLEMHVKDGRVN